MRLRVRGPPPPPPPPTPPGAWTSYQGNRFGNGNITSVSGEITDPVFYIAGRDFPDLVDGIYAYDKNGSLLWSTTSGLVISGSFYAPSFAAPKALSSGGVTLYTNGQAPGGKSPKNIVSAFDTISGHLVWVAGISSTGYGVSVDHISGETRIYAGDAAGNLFAFDGRSGTVIWIKPRYALTLNSGDFTAITATPTVLADHNIIVTGMGFSPAGAYAAMKKLNYTDGSDIWGYHILDFYSTYSQVVVDTSGNEYCCTASGEIISLTSGGTLRWRSAVDTTVPGTTPAIDPATGLIYPRANICLERDTGNVAWQTTNNPCRPSSPELSPAGDFVYGMGNHGTYPNSMWAVSTTSGSGKSATWKTCLSGTGFEPFACPSVDNSGFIYQNTAFGGLNQGLYKLDPNLGGTGFPDASIVWEVNIGIGSTKPTIGQKRP